MKHRIVHALQKYVFNPPVKALLAAGFVPSSHALLETIGRTSGRPRTTPVGNGLVGDTFWIVTEHGLTAGYVRNIQRNPSVRVKVHDRGLRSRRRTGTAQIVAEDDPRRRQRQISRGKPGTCAERVRGTDVGHQPADGANRPRSGRTSEHTG